MTGTFDAFAAIVRSHLTPEERAEGLAFALELPLAAGARLQLPGVVIEAGSAAWLAFIDRQPAANWGHSARYLLVGVDDGAVRSVEARWPPFQAGTDPRWRVVHRAPSVPHALAPCPEQPKHRPE